jgi:hypothetical protein
MIQCEMTRGRPRAGQRVQRANGPAHLRDYVHDFTLSTGTDNADDV